MPSSSSSPPCIKSRKCPPQIQVAMIFVKQKKAWSSLVPRWLIASSFWGFRYVSFFNVLVLSYWLLAQPLWKKWRLSFWERSLSGSVASLCGKLSVSSCACALSCPFISGGLITNTHNISIQAFLGQTVILNIGQWQLRPWRILWSTWGLTWWVGWKQWSLDHMSVTFASGSFTMENVYIEIFDCLKFCNF